nr:ribosomal protein L22 [Paeonia intermedia]WBU13251.1 ribosomal protein L22 [Paeonia intermedia]WBU13335.1 ribosomal protein L22 [Paeonia intermedia]
MINQNKEYIVWFKKPNRIYKNKINTRVCRAMICMYNSGGIWDKK